MSNDPVISQALLYLRQAAPFFAALLLFARIEAKKGLGTAATDGIRIVYDPEFFCTLERKEVEAVLVHEVLHCALQHCSRRKERDPLLWNYAADIVVNGIIAADGRYKLPMGAVRDTALEEFCVEEVYQILHKNSAKVPANLICDLVAPSDAALQDGDDPGSCGARNDDPASIWSHALRSARLIAATSGKGQGALPAGLERDGAALGLAQVNWRSILWRFLVRTPCDFVSFDRRFLHRALYLDSLAGDSVVVNIAVDTSGSVSSEEIRALLTEVTGILRCYPHIRCRLYYADAALYGPHDIETADDIPKPLGGGGTSFVPFFKETADLNAGGAEPAVSIYLTDGFGTFPDAHPEEPVLWVVTAGGLKSESFPFGEVLRLI